MAIGPVEYLVVAFPGNKFKGDIAPALADLVKAGTIRIIDIAFVLKDADGNVVAAEVEDLDSDVGKAFQALQYEIGDLVNEEDLMGIGARMENNTSALVLLWEDVWASKIASALRDAGGVVLGLDRIPYEVITAALPGSALKA